MKNDNPSIPHGPPIDIQKFSDIWGIISQNEEWMQNVAMKIYTDEYMHSSWAAYQANKITEREVFRSISVMLPLFTENSHSPALVVHNMRLVSKMTRFLNPEQIPVMTFDQPLYAIAKRIQWT